MNCNASVWVATTNINALRKLPKSSYNCKMEFMTSLLQDGWYLLMLPNLFSSYLSPTWLIKRLDVALTQKKYLDACTFNTRSWFKILCHTGQHGRKISFRLSISTAWTSAHDHGALREAPGGLAVTGYLVQGSRRPCGRTMPRARPWVASCEVPQPQATSCEAS